MTTISSPHNPRLKELRRLRRRRERERSLRFVAEGEDLLAAARRARWPLLEGYRAAGAKLDGGLDAGELIEVDSELLAEVSTLGSGTRALGVYEQRWSERPVGPLCVYLHGLADPGNVGTVLRAAEAFGASSVALGPGCADPYSPKAVRASMGAIFAVPLARAGAVAELPGERIALVAHAGEPLAELDLAGSLTVLVGAEREGLPREVVAQCERVAHIPIRSESLNAAMAATIALYEMSDLGKRGAQPKPGDTRLRRESPLQPAGLRPAAPPSRVRRA
ncbi:MAG: TrmH family RNA methyltransferase [Solirubrobacterales bacterium]